MKSAIPETTLNWDSSIWNFHFLSKKRSLVLIALLIKDPQLGTEIEEWTNLSESAKMITISKSQWSCIRLWISGLLNDLMNIGSIKLWDEILLLGLLQNRLVSDRFSKSLHELLRSKSYKANIHFPCLKFLFFSAKETLSHVPNQIP